MARKITEIEDSIIFAIVNDERLQELNTESKVAIWRLMVYVLARCIWLLEGLFDLHKEEVLGIISKRKPHSGTWYQNKALDFQSGYDLIEGTDIYDNTGLTPEEIEISKIIKYSAVTELKTESRLIIKIATAIAGKLQPVTIGQSQAFSAYMSEIKDAGVPLSIVNYRPDRLYLSIKIYYDPLVLDAQGYSILTGERPVESAILEHMKELPFNGELILVHLIDKLQKVPGVAIPDLTHAETSWINALTNDYGNIETIDVRRIPESGYFEVVHFNNINYINNV